MTISVTSTTTSQCIADKDPRPTIHANTITALTAAELTRRLVLHRELPSELQYPGTHWEDIQSLLYGAESSLFFPGQQWGGMTADTAIFLQSAPAWQSRLVQKFNCFISW
jgi:hypothetical protein